MWLLFPEMADGIDEKCRIEHGECESQAGEEKTADSAHHAVEEKADEKSADQACEEQEEIVRMLPDRDGIIRDASRIFGIGVSVGGKEPSTVVMPEPLLRIERIFFLVIVGVMTRVV